MSILVCGGAGRLGAQVARRLVERGDRVVVVDDFAAGSPCPEGAVAIDLDLTGDEAQSTLTNAIVDEDVTIVLVVPPYDEVDKSRAHPLRAYSKNVTGLIAALRAVRDGGAMRVVYSSSYAVRGAVGTKARDDADSRSVSPYGRALLVGEWILADCENAWGLEWICLRTPVAVDDADIERIADAHISALDDLARGERPEKCILELS